MLRAARVFQPDHIIILGDFADFYAVSSHSKDPSRRLSLKDEVREVNRCLSLIAELGAAKVTYISGNHEDRFDRYIADRAPEFYGMTSIKDMLKIQERGWDWVPYKTHMTLGKLHVTHDCGKAGKYAHYDAQATFEGNVIIGHTHRLGYTVVGNAEGKPHLGAMLGWLGDIEAVDYMFRIRALRDWAHGFGIGYLLPDESVHVVPIPIVKNTVIIEGKVIS
jgi:predicted phosphodiesterase